MARTKGLEFMMTFVQEYLDGETERMFFDLDFNHYLIENYPKMERYHVQLADCFVYYLSEEGFDRSEGLSDGAHKKLIHRQFERFKEALRQGL